MNRFRRWFRTPAVTVGAFILAIALIALSGIGSARAVLNIVSGNYTATVQMNDIGITLEENGTGLISRDYDSGSKDGTWKNMGKAWNSGDKGSLFSTTFVDKEGKAEGVILDKEYAEKLTVKNSGSINEYVRVTIRRYWKDSEGKVIEKADFPKYIELSCGGTNLDDGSSFGSWVKDAEATTAERIVLYYTQPVAPGGRTAAFTDKIKISSKPFGEYETSEEGGKTVYKYKYDGAQFFMEVSADAVQENNISDAMKSAWGNNPAGISN